jgi:purine-binding chemotaxis protein CheW
MSVGDEAPGGAPAELQQFITLEVKGRTYALPIESIMEFRTWIEPAPLPGTPAHVLGIVNIRGEIVPVFDVAARLGYGPTTPTLKHVIALASTRHEQVVGLLVDDVCDILLCPASAVTQLPPADPAAGWPPVPGVVEVGDGVLGVVDVDALCADSDAPLSLEPPPIIPSPSS